MASNLFFIIMIANKRNLYQIFSHLMEIPGFPTK